MPSAEFEVAKELLRARHAKFTLKPADIEEICISSSHEFYDNATSGNYKVGDMKLAYDWYVILHNQGRYSH